MWIRSYLLTLLLTLLRGQAATHHAGLLRRAKWRVVCAGLGRGLKVMLLSFSFWGLMHTGHAAWYTPTSGSDQESMTSSVTSFGRTALGAQPTNTIGIGITADSKGAGLGDVPSLGNEAATAQNAESESWQPIAEQVQVIRLHLRDERLVLDADIDFDLNPELRELATKGVPLYFTAELELFRPRSWWFDETVLKTQRTWKLMYNALTRQWRIGTGELLLPEASLHDALERIRQLRGWTLLPASELPAGEYYGRLRLQLDTSLLARPIKVESLNRNAWSLGTPWKDFRFSIDDAS